MFRLLKKRIARKKTAKNIYETAALQARAPIFYNQYNVPDSVDGRFEMISLHVILFIRVLNGLGKLKESQSLFDVMFVIMDKSIREIGVGDLSVPKHIKRMMKGFKGRAFNYSDALDSGDMKALQEVVKRNIFGTVEKPSVFDIVALAKYIKQNAAAIDKVTYDELIEFEFSSIEPKEQKEKKSA